jgi:hypothetical protein
MKRACSIGIALLISLFIYLFYRTDKTVVNELAILLLSYDTYASLKRCIVNFVPLSEPIIFSLPGGLWVFCATTLSHEFYIKLHTHKIQVIVVPVLFAIGLELCQLLHLIRGRFDVLDILFYLTFWLLSYFSFRSRGLQQNVLTPFTLDGFICVVCFFSVYLAHVSR